MLLQLKFAEIPKPGICRYYIQQCLNPAQSLNISGLMNLFGFDEAFKTIFPNVTENWAYI